MKGNNDLSVGRPIKILTAFCLPLFASVIFQQIYNIADSLIAGKFIGENALASVGNSYEITLILIAIAMGCNIGSSVIVARLFGEKNYKDLKTAVSTIMISCAVICAVLMVLFMVFGGQMLRLINTPAELFDDSALYLRIYTWGLFWVFFYNITTGIFTALGDSGTPFLFLAASSLANIGMDILFVARFKMGVAGVAWATFICQGISCLLSLLVVYRKLRAMNIQEKVPLFSMLLFRQFLSIAVPSMIQQSFVSIGNIIIQGVINSFGAAVTAGYAAGVKLNNMIISGFVTMGSGMSSYTAQNLGAGKKERLYPGLGAATVITLVIAVPCALIYMTMGRSLIMFFIDQPTAVALNTGITYLKILAPFYLIIPVKILCDGILRGSSHMKEFMIGTFLDLAVRVILSLILSRTSLGATGIWLSWPLGWIIGTAASCLLLNKTYPIKDRKIKTA